MEKYAALVESSYVVPGDERSRTKPGHGYPEHTVDYTEVIKFKDYDEMITWVKNKESKVFYREKYQIIKYVEMTVSSTIAVEVKVN